MTYIILSSEQRISQIEICNIILIIMCLLGIYIFRTYHNTISLFVTFIVCLASQIIFVTTYDIIFVLSQIIIMVGMLYLAYQIRLDFYKNKSE